MIRGSLSNLFCYHRIAIINYDLFGYNILHITFCVVYEWQLF